MADSTEMQDKTKSQQGAFQGASVCPSCASLGEFDLPSDEGQFQIACYDCDHIYDIDAAEALATALMRDIETGSADCDDEDAPASTISCLSCGGTITVPDGVSFDDASTISCPHCVAANDDEPQGADDSDDSAIAMTHERFNEIATDTPTRFDLPPVMASSKTGRTSIILVSILSIGLFMTAAMVALGLYFLTLRTDSDLSRYIEANILQLTPATFDVQTASYEISETDLGKSLLVTITINNSGQVEGAPEEMQIVLVDAQNQPIISWPLDTAGQIIAPGQSTQLYTRLFEPPEEFANLRVMVR